MHVPRTAGTSLLAALEQALGPGALSPKRFDTALLCGGFRDLELLDPEVRARFAVDSDDGLSDYPVIGGHFALRTLLPFTRPASIATVLREPRSRLLSAYAFWRLRGSTQPAWRAYHPLEHALRPLDEFLEEPLIARITDNVVCRMVLAEGSQIPELDFIAPGDADVVATRALEVLDTFGYVGILELGDIWEGVSRFFGVALSEASLNSATWASEQGDAPAADLTITDRILDLLEARTAADSIVYRSMLLRAGCSEEHADRLRAAALATELLRVGDAMGPFATQSRARGRTIDELTHRLARKDAELGEKDEELARLHAEIATRDAEIATRDAELVSQGQLFLQKLARAEDQLRCHREWLDAIQRSASWRLTAPLRAVKRAAGRRAPTD